MTDLSSAPLCKIDPPLLPLSDSRQMILVTAALLIDSENRVLLAQRPSGKPLPGLWEFPGGKIDADELPEIALVRELKEELGVDVKPECLTPLTFSSHAYPDFHLLMLVFACHRWQGVPYPREGQTLAWATKHEWRNYTMPPADERILPILFGMI